jgi:hypothetical protein
MELVRPERMIGFPTLKGAGAVRSFPAGGAEGMHGLCLAVEAYGNIESHRGSGGGGVDAFGGALG